MVRIHSMIDDDDWDKLLDRIDEGNLLPIIGWGVTTFGENDALLTPWLAGELAKKLRVSLDGLPHEFTLSDVITRYLMSGNERDDVYGAVHKILKDAKLVPGETLKQLASVTGLKLLLSMTPDSLLKQAIDSVKYGGHDATTTCQFSPKLAKYDTPGRLQDLHSRPESTVCHILGKSGTAVEGFVTWDDDLLEFVLKLNECLGPDLMPNLSKDLEDKSVVILALGVSYSDWLMRFFLRVIRQKSLTSPDLGITRLVEASDPLKPENVVMFFGRVARKVIVFDLPPKEFVRELAARWTTRHPPAEQPAEFVAISTVADEMRPGAVFISYMREDEAAVRQIVSRLQAAGCDVWLDLDRLKSGMNFNIRIEEYIRSKCSLFVSVISGRTEKQAESYAQRERIWASNRATGIADAERDKFYHPVIVDDDLDPGQIRMEPTAFNAVHRPRYIGGNVDNDFCQRIHSLQLEWLNRHKAGVQ